MRFACARRGCDGEATLVPVLLLFLVGRSKPMRMLFDVKHCKPCADETAVSDLVSDDAWKRTATIVSAPRLPMPVRDRTRAEWISIGSEEQRHYALALEKAKGH